MKAEEAFKRTVKVIRAMTRFSDFCIPQAVIHQQNLIKKLFRLWLGCHDQRTSISLVQRGSESAIRSPSCLEKWLPQFCPIKQENSAEEIWDLEENNYDCAKPCCLHVVQTLG